MSNLNITHALQEQISSNLTPKDTGHLRGSYAAGDITRRGDEYVIKVYMPTLAEDTA